jgi:hypothetical protein
VSRLRLVHWHEGEGEERAVRLRAAGHRVEARPPRAGGAELRTWRDDPPDAVVIDLSRLPSHGRDVGAFLRTDAVLRRVPLVFVGGAADKVARVRHLLPDATYTTWERIDEDLAAALAAPPDRPVVPPSNLAGYSGTPLPRKLGVKPGGRVMLVDAPADFEVTLGELPDDASVGRDGDGPRDLTVWFVRSRAALDEGLGRQRDLAPGGLWIAWPKKASGFPTDLSESAVRTAGLAAGLVDHKICAIDATWSGLRFARRR